MENKVLESGRRVWSWLSMSDWEGSKNVSAKLEYLKRKDRKDNKQELE